MADNDQPPDGTTPPEGTPPELDDDAYIAGLDDRARRLVERANTEAARFRHDLRETQQARQAVEERLQTLEREHETEQERVVREAEERGRSEGKAEVDRITADFERRLATMAIKAKAADRFADADDAVRLLPLDDLLAESDEQTRDRKVDKALADLLEQKPYLGRDSNGRRPLVTQGGRSDQPGGRPRERSWLRG